jgi:hypothetical protein
VSWKASANAAFVSAESQGAQPLVANRTAVGDWERFQLYTNWDGSVSLRSKANDQFVSADLNQSAVLIARAGGRALWQIRPPSWAWTVAPGISTPGSATSRTGTRTGCAGRRTWQFMANGNGKVGLRDRIKEGTDKLWSSQLAESIMRPGSPFKEGYSDSPRNRSYVVMNNVLYHLHPVKVKRHGVKLSYTLCLGGLSFFPFILLTITGIFLMFYYTPTAEVAYADMEALSTQVAFGSLVRNLHRWGAHLMVLSVFLHMSRVFYHGAYKPPREFNWVVGVVLLFLTLFLSFSGYLLPWDQLALWAVTVGSNMAGFSPVIGDQIKFALLAGVEVTGATLLRFYVLHVLAFPFIIVIFMAVHFWRVRKDGGISGPL